MSEQTPMDTGTKPESTVLDGPDGPREDGGVDVVIARETRRIMGEWLAIPHTNPTVAAEARRLQQLTETRAEELEDVLRQRWLSANPGRTPTSSDTAAMRQDTWDQARKEILEVELYPRVTPEIIAEIKETDAMIAAMLTQTIAERRERKDPERWKDFHVNVTPLACKIVDRVWLHRDGAFRVRAQCLVQQRLEDNQRTPTTSVSPIAPVLEAIVCAEIAATPADRLPF
ncbi:hypothetical protein [Tomitella biformata]|uniref:hypothetical protein n=1 Tax=Tomitella biformata TaxID=630403 RepID=UPI000466FB35|nr:hypothetical protein [Tomitella biformata]